MVVFRRGPAVFSAWVLAIGFVLCGTSVRSEAEGTTSASLHSPLVACTYPLLEGHPDPEAYKGRLLALVNAERCRFQILPLHPNAALARSAQDYADEMYQRGFFSHTDPMGHTLTDRIRASGFLPEWVTAGNCNYSLRIGENLATGQQTPEEVVDAWMKSPPHRRALLNPKFTETGFGMAAGKWVEHFAGPIVCLSTP